MKVLHVGTFTCPNAESISQALEAEGVSVTRVEESSVSADDVVSMARGHDWLLCEEGRLKNDHWSSKDGKNHIEGYFQKVIDEAGVPIVSWLTNIFMGVEPREIEVKHNPIFQADVVFSTDGGHEEAFKAAGVVHVPLRQGIDVREAYIANGDYPTRAQIGFIGSVYDNIWPYRKKLVDWLAATYGDKFEHFGQDGKIRHDELNRLCATLKIVVGDSVRSPRYWSNRIYEITGRGGFIIHPMTEGLDEEFTPYEHFIPYEYGDFKGLKEKIDYFLTHDAEREKIRLAGFEHCKTNHTYGHRVREMLKVLRERGIIKT
jgi:spore maturation protein CgeB